MEELKVKYTIINSSINLVDPPPMPKTILKCIHNAGFFSNNTIALQDIVYYFNQNKALPDEVDRHEQYMHYKSYAGETLINVYFKETPDKVEYSSPITMRLDCMAIQFDKYSNIPFSEVLPIVNKYFQPSDKVLKIEQELKDKYNLDYNNLCSVFYRGNDKSREMKVASYDYFIDKAKEIKAKHPNIRFLVQPDEREFLQAFQSEFPDCIYFEETPMLSKQDSAMFFELPKNERPEYGAKFFAAVLCHSKCNQVITHSGNIALWLSLYRGNADNINQIFNDQWL